MNKFLTVPLTIAELNLESRNGRNWRCVQGELKPLRPDMVSDFEHIQQDSQANRFRYDFTENLYIFEDTKHMLFCRLTADNDPALGQAVLGLYSNFAPFDVKRLRLLLIMRSSLNQFISSHYNNDSLVAFVDERSKLLEAERLKHGYTIYLSFFSDLAKNRDYDLCDRDALIDLYHDMVSSGPILPKLLNAYEEAEKAGTLKNSEVRISLKKIYKLEKFNPKTILDHVWNLVVLVYSSDIYETEEVDIKKNLTYFSFDGDLKNCQINFYQGLLSVIVAEVLINGKKAQKKYKGEYKVSVTLSASATTGLYYLTISNNIKTTDDLKTLERLKKNNSRYDTHGIGLIRRITHIFCGEFATVDIVTDPLLSELSFQTRIPLKNISDE